MAYRRSLFHPSHKRKIVRSPAKAHEEQWSTMHQADPQQNGLIEHKGRVDLHSIPVSGCGSPLFTG